MKYIMYDETEPVVFPESWDHAIIHQMVMSHFPGLKAISAGYVSIENDKAQCYRYSHTMDLRPEERDQDILTRALVTS